MEQSAWPHQFLRKRTSIRAAVSARGSRFVRLSIVSTMYRSAPFIEEYCEPMTKAALTATADDKIVQVSDGLSRPYP